MNMCLFCITSSNWLNEYVANLVQHVRAPFLTSVALVITDLGDPATVAMLAFIVILFFWLHNKKRHMIQFIVTLSIASLLVWLIKIIVELPRPIGGLIPETGFSFVSGHATFATVFFSLIAYSYKNHIRNKGLRRLFTFLNFLAAFMVGLTRVYLGVHYTTDIIGGFILGLVVSAISILIFEAYERKHPVN